MDSPPEIEVLPWGDEELAGVDVTIDPAVVQGQILSISACDPWEIFIDQRIRVIEASIFGLQEMMFDVVDGIADYFVYPFFFYSILPLSIEGCHRQPQIIVLICYFQASPQL